MEIGKRAADCLLESEPQDAASYVLLSNIYASVGKWDDAMKVRTMMKERGVKKDPGYSWIKLKNEVHAFLVGDTSHPQTEEIYAKLASLTEQMKVMGYIPDISFVLHDVEQEQKEHFLSYHSEKLAIAFGIIHTPAGTPIKIIKNLRVCGDCHSAIKFISQIVGRKIVVRDSNRYHHFMDGLCSCGDYW
jgi:pentatricopeptide repeat protein